MSIKDELLSINLDNLHWEQQKISSIIKRLKDYGSIRKELEVALIHISKQEFDNAKKIISELKNSPQLDSLIQVESKKGLFHSFKSLFQKTAVATAVAGVTLGAVNADAKNINTQKLNSSAKVQVMNENVGDINRYLDRAGKELELSHVDKSRGMYFNAIGQASRGQIKMSYEQSLNAHLGLVATYKFQGDKKQAIFYLEYISKNFPKEKKSMQKMIKSLKEN